MSSVDLASQLGFSSSSSSGGLGGTALHQFFVYNPLFGPRDENEHEKLLFFWPPDAPLDTKLKNVGLSEAMVNFTKTFSPDRPCEYVHTLKRRMVFYNPEPNYWIVMSVNLPFFRKGTKDGSISTDYLESEVHDSVLNSIVRQGYQMFKLFHNSFGAIVEKFAVQTLRHKLEEFFPSYFKNIVFDQMDMLVTLDGINFLPLDKTVYLRVQSMINMAENKFPEITYSCFLYNHYLVSSELEQDDIRILYHYLTWGFMDGSPCNHPSVLERSSSKQKSTSSRSGFLTGPADLKDPDTPVNLPKVFIGPEGMEHYLVVYQFLEITLVFLIVADETTFSRTKDIRFYTSLDNFLSGELQELAAAIQKEQNRKSLPEAAHKYIYFNSMNLALKATFASSYKIPNSREAMHLITDIQEDFENFPRDTSSEILSKSASDFWVVGRRSEQRDLYVTIFKKDTTLIDVNDEMKKLTSTHFQNIFME